MRNNKGFVSLLVIFVGFVIFAFAYFVIWNMGFLQNNLRRSESAFNNFINAISYVYNDEDIRNADIMLEIEDIEEVPDAFLQILQKDLVLDENLSPTAKSPVTHFTIDTIELIESENPEEDNLQEIYIRIEYSPRSLRGLFSDALIFEATNRLKFKGENEEKSVLENTNEDNLEEGEFYLIDVSNPYIEFQDDANEILWPYNYDEIENIFKANTNIRTAIDTLDSENEDVVGFFVFKKYQTYEDEREDLREVAIGSNHILGLTLEGNVIGWGDDYYNQISIPEELTDNSIEVVSVQSGANHSLALDESGNIYAWGDDSYNQLAIPENLPEIQKIEAGENFSVALSVNGDVYAWGLNSFGQLNVPNIGDFEDIQDIAVGNAHVIALKSSGEVFSWGKNDYGQIDIDDNLTVSDIWAGKDYSIVQTTQGNNYNLYFYGENEFVIPFDDNGDIRHIIVSPLADHMILLFNDDTYEAFGKNDDGQIDIPEDFVIDFAYTGARNTVLETSEGLYIIGNNDYEQLYPPPYVRYIPNYFAIEAIYDYDDEDEMWFNETYFPEEVENRFVYFSPASVFEDPVFTPPGQDGDPPGQGGTPPGQGGTPPGQGGEEEEGDFILEDWILIESQVTSLVGKYMNMPDGGSDTRIILNPDLDDRRNHWNLSWVDDGAERGYRLSNREEDEYVARISSEQSDFEIVKSTTLGDDTFFNPAKVFGSGGEEVTLDENDSNYFMYSYEHPDRIIGRENIDTELLSGVSDSAPRNRWRLSYAIPEQQPIVEEKDQDSITLVDMGENIEYRINEGSWQSDNEFTDLEPSTEYTFQLRRTSDSINEINIDASEPSEGVVISTDEPIPFLLGEDEIYLGRTGLNIEKYLTITRKIIP